MKINSIWRDYSGAVRVMSKRKKKFRAASHEPVKKDVIGDVARRLHPGKIDIKLVNIKNSTNNSKIIRFEGKNIPYFRPGQFLTLEYNNGKLGGVHIGRLRRPHVEVQRPLEVLYGA